MTTTVRQRMHSRRTLEDRVDYLQRKLAERNGEGGGAGFLRGEIAALRFAVHEMTRVGAAETYLRQHVRHLPECWRGRMKEQSPPPVLNDPDCPGCVIDWAFTHHGLEADQLAAGVPA